MPELPEVETIARTLRLGYQEKPALIGMSVSAVQVLWPGSIAVPQPAQLVERMKGQVIQAIGRRAKYLVFTLSRDKLIIHLRMSGDLRVEHQDEPQAIHDRVIFFLNEPWRLTFNDARKFGRVWLVDNAESVLSGLGPEPLSDEFTVKRFYGRLQERRRQLKPLLMDQSFLAGVGNIYADEALHSSKLHPLTISNELSFPQVEKLLTAIRETLGLGIEQNGASIDWVYRGGNFQNNFQVYARAGEPCTTCGAPIVRIVVGQRGTYFCPVCQPQPGSGNIEG